MDIAERNKIIGENKGFQIGELQNLKKDDPTISDYWEAIKQAEEKSIDDEVWAVWTSQKEGSELMAIIYQGHAYTA